MNKRQTKGFTLVELLVAMAIIGLLIAAAIWGIGLAQQSSRNTQRRNSASAVVAGLSEYYSRFNVPATCVFANSDPTAPTLVFSNTAPASCTTLALATAGTAPAHVYTITLQGAGNPFSDRNTSTALTAAELTASLTDASSAYYVIQTHGTTPALNGNMICLYLEGSGTVNYSDPQTITCP